MNIGFTWDGLRALGLPTETLRGMPEEFIDGMASRRSILGDIGRSDPCNWDRVWRHCDRDDPRRVHILITLHAQTDARGEVVPAMQEWTDWLQDLVVMSRGGVTMLEGHGPAREPWQDSNAIMDLVEVTDPVTGARSLRKKPTAREHFGFMDGISDPVFRGQTEEPEDAIGAGKIIPGRYDVEKSWQPLATGEFILGHPSEGQELPLAAQPAGFMRNGTFMAVRKLHQNIRSFRETIDAQAARYRAVAGLESEEEARETLKAKMVGRWTSGIPLSVAPTWKENLALQAKLPGMSPREVNRLLTAFRYADDPEGLRCPVSSHIRRSNPRDMLDPVPGPDGASSHLINRRRIMRRGLPYGVTTDDDEGEHGVFIMAVCASLFRQFEFVQQQWMHYGLDFNVGNDTCPITGHREGSAKFVIAAAPKGCGMPYIADRLPLFVETRGGDYFFIPSLTALRMIAMGTVDPT
jgi:Dyp-type peroxidase family